MSRGDSRDAEGPADHPPGPTSGYRALARAARAVAGLLRWRIRVRGHEHVPDRGGAVITWNHHGHLDMVVTAVALLQLTGRPARILGHRRYFDVPVLSWMLDLVDAIPVGGPHDAFADSVEAAAAGHLILIAPAGRIAPSFEPQPFRTGAARVARRAGVPLVPSASWGVHRASSVGRRLVPSQLWRLPVELAFGPPLAATDVRGATRTAREATTELLRTLQHTYPDGAPDGAWWVPSRLGGGAPSPSRGPARRHEPLSA